MTTHDKTAHAELEEAALEFRLAIIKTMLDSLRQVEKFFHDAADELQESLDTAERVLAARALDG